MICPGCENSSDYDNMHLNDNGEYYDDCYMNVPEEFLNKTCENKEINENVREVMCYNNVSMKIAIELMIDDVVENVIRFVDKIDKPDIDYIRSLLKENNWDIMKCVQIMEEEEKHYNNYKKTKKN